MPGQNDFRAFAAGGGANALTPSAYAALTPLLANGFQAGTASSAQINTVLRQVTSMAAALGKIISDAELNAVDDGNVTTLAARLISALQGQFVSQTALETRLTRSWQDLSASRVHSVAYQNTTTKEIFVMIRGASTSGDGRTIQISPNGATWRQIGAAGQDGDGEGSGFPVPVGWYYRVVGAMAAGYVWEELR